MDVSFDWSSVKVWLRGALGEAAAAAARTKHTYLSARYRRLASRRGKKRAKVAIKHDIATFRCEPQPCPRRRCRGSAAISQAFRICAPSLGSTGRMRSGPLFLALPTAAHTT